MNWPKPLDFVKVDDVFARPDKGNASCGQRRAHPGPWRGCLQVLGVAGLKDVVGGALGTVLVGTFIIDQLGVVGGELS